MTIYECQNCGDLFEDPVEYHEYGGYESLGCPSCASSDAQEVRPYDPRYKTLYRQYLDNEFGGKEE